MKYRVSQTDVSRAVHFVITRMNIAREPTAHWRQVL
jgi:hypothetical protein